MNKRTIIILTIISSVISIGYILLEYFGIKRYLLLRFSNNSDKLIENYHKLQEHKHKNKVIISLYIDENDLDKIRPTINSILDQTIKVNQIILIMKNLNNKEPILPEYLTKIVNVLPIGKDYGKGNNIVPLLFKEKECSTTIIGIDKNVIYGKDFLEIILDENENNPNSIILDHNKNAILLKPKHYGCEILKRDTENYNIEWFINNTNNHKIINYNENYYY